VIPGYWYLTAAVKEYTQHLFSIHCKIPEFFYFTLDGVLDLKVGMPHVGMLGDLERESPAVHSRSKALAKGLEEREHQMLKHFCKCKIYVSSLVENKYKIYVAHFQKRIWPASAVLLF